MQYIQNIEKLFSEVQTVFPAQITIDFFEDFEDQFFDDSRDLKTDPIERDEIGAKQYEIGNILDIIDKQKFAKDVDIFNRMYAELQKWYDEIEARNKVLGIPWHKG